MKVTAKTGTMVLLRILCSLLHCRVNSSINTSAVISSLFTHTGVVGMQALLRNRERLLVKIRSADPNTAPGLGGNDRGN